MIDRQIEFETPANVETTNSVIVTVEGQDQILSQETLGINFDSSETEILNAVEGILSEMGHSLRNNDDFTFIILLCYQFLVSLVKINNFHCEFSLCKER